MHPSFISVFYGSDHFRWNIQIWVWKDESRKIRRKHPWSVLLFVSAALSSGWWLTGQLNRKDRLRTYIFSFFNNFQGDLQLTMLLASFFLGQMNFVYHLKNKLCNINGVLTSDQWKLNTTSDLQEKIEIPEWRSHEGFQSIIEGHEWWSIQWSQVMTALITLLSIQGILTKQKTRQSWDWKM